MEITSKLRGLFDTPEHAFGTLNRFGPPLVSLLLVALIASMLASQSIVAGSDRALAAAFDVVEHVIKGA